MLRKHRLLLATIVIAMLVSFCRAQADNVDVESLPEGAEAIAEVCDENSCLSSGQGSCLPSTTFALTVGIPNTCSGWQFNGGVLMLQPSADNLGWAVLTTEKNFASPVPIASPYWTIETLRPGYSPGFEIGGAYRFARPGADFQINWQHLQTSTSQVAGVNQGDGQWISPFSQTGPPTADSFDEIYAHTGVGKLLNASANVKFAYDAVNFDFGQAITIGRPLMLRFLAGLTFARVQDALLSSFYGTPPPPGTAFPDSVPLVLHLNNTSTFTGVGPRFGVDTTYQTARGLRFTGQLAGAALIGPTQPAQYQFSATAPGLASLGIPVNQEQIYSRRYYHVVPAINARLGVGYTRLLRNGSLFTVDGGYLATVFINSFAGYETNENIIGLQLGALSTGSVRSTLSNFSANGFFVNFGLKW